MTASTVSAEPATQTPQRSNDYPPGIPYIVGNEGAERFSYYGMKAILYVYLTSLFVHFVDPAQVGETDMAAARAHATEIVHLFNAGVYLFPLIGAVLADRLLGKYNVIFWVSLIYCAGHAVLAVAGRLGEMGQIQGAELGMYAGLALIAVGSGGIKPCVSANVGDQFTAKNAHLVTGVFQIFYFIINFGSLFSTLLTPYLYRVYGAEVAFGVPGVLMGIATFIFWLGRKKFIHQKPQPGGMLGVWDTLSTILLFSPIFALLTGYFVMWEGFAAALPSDASLGEIFTRALIHYLPLLGLTAAGVVAGFALFSYRQRIEPSFGFLSILVYSFRAKRSPGDGFFDPAKREFGEEIGEGPVAVLRIMLVFSMVSVFWALFDQHASTWIEQANQMDLSFAAPAHLWQTGLVTAIGLSIFGGTWLMFRVSNVLIPSSVVRGILAVAAVLMGGAGLLDLLRGTWTEIELEAPQLSALNPLMVMMIIPGLNAFVWQPLSQRGIVVPPLRKMTIGMFLAAVAFMIAAVLQMRIESVGEGQVHALWQVVPYLVMTTSEVLVSVTGLEFAYTQAPRTMKSTIMGFWLLGVTMGNLLVAFLAPLQKTYELSQFFWLFTGLMTAAAVIFAVLAAMYRGKTYLQHA